MKDRLKKGFWNVLTVIAIIVLAKLAENAADKRNGNEKSETSSEMRLEMLYKISIVSMP